MIPVVITQDSDESPVRLSPRDSTIIRGRRITQDDLKEIERLLGEAPFETIQVAASDEQGRHEPSTVAAVLGNLLWHSVRRFTADARQTVRAGERYEFGSISVDVHKSLGTYISWSASPHTDRERIERTYKRMLALYRSLPRNVLSWPGSDTIFTTKEAEAKRSWWQVWRKPESFTDWLVSGPVYSIALAVTIAVVLVAVPK